MKKLIAALLIVLSLGGLAACQSAEPDADVSSGENAGLANPILPAGEEVFQESKDYGVSEYAADRYIHCTATAELYAYPVPFQADGEGIIAIPPGSSFEIVGFVSNDQIPEGSAMPSRFFEILYQDGIYFIEDSEETAAAYTME
ncbi:MAG: hypothetical protein LBQ15_13630 [Clostridium sp.]|jgi:hypothetical protein|nr:hypothetical protein [Clostridium sp.]